ncbi:MAG: HAMP domain-containing protein, partial [Clostridia bacterium]|nr:HAMP domain-containing protein [Clostridia bacterium]
KARALGNLACEFMDSGQDGAMQALVSQLDPSLLGAYFAVFGNQGEIIYASDDVSMEDVKGFTNMVNQVLSGQEVTASGITAVTQITMVGVGTPIIRDGVQRGGVLMFLPMYEAYAALSSLNLALTIALICAIPIVALLVFVMMERVVRPLRQMRDVALSMAAGNYAVRADDSQKGEVGQLAQSLNHLARELSRNIGDLTLERNRLIQSLDGLSEGFISVNTLGRVTHHNPAVSEMFNMPYQSGEIDREVLLTHEGVWADFDEAIRGNTIVLRDTDIGGRLIHSTITPFDGENGEVAGAVGLFTDITESERLERTRRDYVANVSHELRTPLTAMRALIEPLKDGMIRSEEARMRYYDIILRETMRLSRLIDDLMELSRLQSGKISIDKQVMPLEEMILDLAEKYSATAEDKGQKFNLMFDPATCPQVVSNPDRVEQVLVILLDNAMKYTPEGGEIFLNARWNDSHVVLSVRDTGIGISESDLPYVFDRFYKADKSRTGSSGSGLGLSIAREMLRWMGEDIVVTSEKGKGSEFSFTLKRYEKE